MALDSAALDCLVACGTAPDTLFKRVLSTARGAPDGRQIKMISRAEEGGGGEAVAVEVDCMMKVLALARPRGTPRHCHVQLVGRRKPLDTVAMGAPLAPLAPLRARITGFTAIPHARTTH